MFGQGTWVGPDGSAACWPREAPNCAGRSAGGPGGGAYHRRLMLLVIDIGNTNISLGIARAGELGAARRAQTSPAATADELELLIDGLLALDSLRLTDIDEVVVASVVPALTASLADACRRRGISLLIADAQSVPLAVRVDRPTEVGADRLVNALAAGRLHGTPAIVVDFGTATNFDVVAADGAYVGGAIAPGLELGLEALAARAAKLPRVDLVRPEQAIGRNTAGAMQSGAVIGHIGLVRELLAAIKSELAAEGQPPPRVILTGGLSAAPWASEIPGVDTIDPLLTLRGLVMLHAEAGARAAR
jgi:type III pantothenate kinase